MAKMHVSKKIVRKGAGRAKAEVQKSYPDLHHWQGGMKFATQISHLLNLYHSVN